MRKLEARALFAAREIEGVSRVERPRCGAKTRKGGRCKAQALANGKCRMHGGLSTGPRTKEGKASRVVHARKQMLERWVTYRGENGGKVPLTDAGRQKIRETARRTMRMRHRKRQALAWSVWMMRQHSDCSVRIWADSRKRVILRPYQEALKRGGIDGLCEMVEIAGIDLRLLPDGTELYGAILARYPSLNIANAALDLRRGAESTSS